MFEQLGADLGEPDFVEPRDEVMGSAADFEELRQRSHAVGRRILRLEVFVKLRLQAGHPHLEELVEIRCTDRQEPEPLEQRVRRVARFLEHALVEVEPAQLAIDEQARVERAAGSARRTAVTADHCVDSWT